MSKKSQERYKLAGLCIFCGKVPPREGKRTCCECSERSRKYNKARAAKRIALGKCSKCGRKNLVTKRHCRACAKKHQESARKNYLIMRDRVFEAYGGYCCACCGEKERAFLTIDHIHNDGCKHRKEIGQSNCYRWLRDNDYPSGFQVLCMNCQWGRKNCNGVCPHQTKRE